MKSIITGFLVFTFLNSFEQTSGKDSLAKYSYGVIGFTFPKGIFFGSGFFMRNNGSIYFITAKHVLTGCDHGVLPSKFPTSMNIFLKDCMQVISIENREIRKKYSCRSSRPDSDYVVVKIDNKYSNCVNSVEKFLCPPFEHVKDVHILGYPEWAYSISDTLFNPFVTSIQMPLNRKNLLFTGCKDSATGVIDSTVMVINSPAFMINYDSLGGFSGAPIFIQDSLTRKWRIAGIFTSNTYDNTGRVGIECTLIEMAIKKIDEY